jgi:hypothetical protein
VFFELLVFEEEGAGFFVGEFCFGEMGGFDVFCCLLGFDDLAE